LPPREPTLPIRKAIAINDDRAKITDLFSLVAKVRTEAKKLFQGRPIRILPTLMYDVHFHSYIFLVECTPTRKGRSFEDAMSKLKGRT
jgi:hypothetical protein